MVFLAIFLQAFKFLLTRFRIGTIIYERLSKMIYFNMILRCLLEGYLEFSLSSLLNLYKLEWDNPIESLCSVLTIVLTVVLLLFPIFVGVLLITRKTKLSDPKFQDKYGSLYSEVKYHNTSALLFHVFFILRRLVFAFTAVVMTGDSAIVQI
jgi:hypothetical protein